MKLHELDEHTLRILCKKLIQQKGGDPLNALESGAAALQALALTPATPAPPAAPPEARGETYIVFSCDYDGCFDLLFDSGKKALFASYVKTLSNQGKIRNKHKLISTSNGYAINNQNDFKKKLTQMFMDVLTPSGSSKVIFMNGSIRQSETKDKSNRDFFYDKFREEIYPKQNLEQILKSIGQTRLMFTDDDGFLFKDYSNHLVNNVKALGFSSYRFEYDTEIFPDEINRPVGLSKHQEDLYVKKRLVERQITHIKSRMNTENITACTFYFIDDQLVLLDKVAELKDHAREQGITLELINVIQPETSESETKIDLLKGVVVDADSTSL